MSTHYHILSCNHFKAKRITQSKAPELIGVIPLAGTLSYPCIQSHISQIQTVQLDKTELSTQKYK